MGSDTPELFHRKRFQNRWYLILVYPAQAIGLREIARKLGDENIRPDAGRTGNAEIAPYRGLDGLGQALRAAEKVMRTGDIQENLVD